MSEGFLDTENGQKLWYQVRGNGIPVLFLHGGPGAGCSGYEDINKKLFLSQGSNFQLIEFDQRSCGRSVPGLSECLSSDWQEKARDLRIDTLVDDCERLRRHLGISHWMLFGGSWGSTLALRYGIRHPGPINGMILRGIFLASKAEVAQFFTESGRKDDPHGLNQLRQLQECLGPETDKTCGESVLRDLSRQILAGSESVALRYALDEKNTMTGENRQISELSEEEKKELFLEAFLHSALIPSMAFGSESVDLLEDLSPLKNIPVWMVHGIDDTICPVSYADLLGTKLEQQNVRLQSYIRIEGAGHSCSEPGIFEALKTCIDDYGKQTGLFNP